MRKLTNKQQAFVNEYLQSWNATEAAIKAGYSTNSARAIGSENLTKPNIQSAIQHKVKEMTMSADEALISLTDIARSDMNDFVTVTGRNLLIDFGKAQERNKLKLMKKLRIKKDEVSFELYDKQTALNTIAKHHGLLKDHIEIDINIVVAVIDALQVLGQDPVQVFNEIIARAKAIHDANS